MAVMRTDIRCKVCQTKLSVKIELQGKNVRCPRCQNPVRVTLAPVVLPHLANKQANKPASAAGVPVGDEPMLAEVLPDDYGDFDVLPDDEPATPARPPAPPVPVPQPKPASRPARVNTPTPVEDDSDSEATPKPKKKKKKGKKYSKAEDITKVPAWMWIAGAFGALFVTSGVVFGIVLALRTRTVDGEGIDFQAFLIEFCILVPINVVVLVLGMVISSALGGGINFGDAKWAIAGSFFLVIVVVLVSLIPIVGRYLTLIVWLVGFMTIFGLDPWEARFLLFICWLLSYACNMAYAHFQHRQWEKAIDRWEEKEDRWRNRNDPDPDDQGYLPPDDLHRNMRAWIERRDASMTRS